MPAAQPKALSKFARQTTHIERFNNPPEATRVTTGPRRVVLFQEACQVIGCHCQSLDQDIVLTGDRLDRQMSRQSCQALDEKTSEPLECDPSRTTDTASGNPCHYQAFDKTPLFLREEVWLTVRDKLASTIVTMMVLFAVMNVTIFLLDSIIIPLCWIRYLPLLTGNAQTGAIRAYNSSMSRYRCDGCRGCASCG